MVGWRGREGEFRYSFPFHFGANTDCWLIPFLYPTSALSPWTPLLIEDNLSCPIALACSLGTALIDNKIDFFWVCYSVSHFENCHQPFLWAWLPVGLNHTADIPPCWQSQFSSCDCCQYSPFLLTISSTPSLLSFTHLHHPLPPEILPDPSRILYQFGLICNLMWLCLARSFACAGWDLEIGQSRWLVSLFWSISNNVTLIWGSLYLLLIFPERCMDLTLLVSCSSVRFGWSWLESQKTAEQSQEVSQGQGDL